ncbi:hypothetical protein P5V63_03110 [Mycobacteroides abscessus subsp. abscessus]|uniref:hypothetical protein n=1 Tax=Mycobacteroides abscessus TaxID=36809 RepID=UPI0009278CF5|nr:hypothetical protein [Mycobacteroides abscessus]MDO3091989.1 hypothetical protein [Mycobacteroides abscessus subsp. abscessus]MDO3333065.1 hypothetical protein [Mycobacteroides abscessus subsp. bolletii]QSM89569.1 hypothetical protein I3U44_02145 [Mycobacteroides abscessus subsp. bolletii]SHX52536.1 Uncharacterised protein [Mycobacteroides abscessus subsp. abscessus]SHY64057.1 Uncharacterised protein [Mycobacteroides abscessus subsp. abscessus]
MFETDFDDEPEESVSLLALDVMDELRMKMLECLLVLQALPHEADLNLSDLVSDVRAAHQGTQEAYRAASLVHQGAELDGRWGSSLSRPKAIFARHNSAVRRGATKVAPMSAPCDRVEQQLYQLPRSDRSQDIVGQRPKCVATVRSTGENCASSVIYLGAGMFGAHCYSHATSDERERYRVHHEGIEARPARTYEDLRELQRALGQEIAAHWISTRAQRIEWIEKKVTQH